MEHTTLRGLIKATCANMYPDGSCNGPRYDDKLKPIPFPPQPRCLVTHGERCLYFEESILPGITDANIIRQYHTINAKITSMFRRCADCDKPTPSDRKYCKECAQKRHEAKKAKNYDHRYI